MEISKQPLAINNINRVYSFMKTRHFPRAIKLAILFIVMSLCVGCGIKRNALPPEYQDQASVVGFENIRTFGDELPKNFEAQVATWSEQLSGTVTTADDLSILSLSGGGADGAFGAGILVGWTARGDRPEFFSVTGISTGALIAPFAFLGKDYDHLIQEFYTTSSTEDIVRRRFIFSALFGDSFLDTAPLRSALEESITQDIIVKIAQEHRKGRRLFIGTTDLDAMRPVYWNIGAIAQRGDEEATQLIRSIVLASASIPTVFPPVYIDVEVDGVKYDEMHVDGGVSNQLFAYPANINLYKLMQEMGYNNDLSIYVIRNNPLKSKGEIVQPTIRDITAKSMSTLLRYQGIGDLYKIYNTARRDGVDFNLIFVPSTFQEESDELFSIDYMTKLFELGRSMAVKGTPWHKIPPYDFDTTN